MTELEKAAKEWLILNLMMDMRKWAELNNSGWKGDWYNEEEKKWGITINSNIIEVSKSREINSFLFQISVKTEDLADKMCKEFYDLIDDVIEFI